LKWIGEIPEHWRIDKLRYVLNLSTGLSITKAEFVPEGIKCINYGDIHSKYTFDYIYSRDEVNKIPYDYITKKESATTEDGDFIFCDTSEDIEGSGNCLFIRDKGDEVVISGSHTIMGKPSKNVYSPFLGYLLKSKNVKSQIEIAVVGIKVYSITQKILKEVIFLLPPFEEQVAIGKFLDEKSKIIAESINNKNKLIEELESYKKSLIYEVVTGKKEID
jgi:type I restriction enzyme S subunit